MKHWKVVLLACVLLPLLTGIASAATLTVIIVGTGYGNVDGEDIACRPFCSADYEKKSIVHLKATPYDNSTFEGWMVNGKPHEGVITIDQEDILITARFELESTPDELEVMWYNGSTKQRAGMVLDELAVFIEPWEKWDVSTQDDFNAAIQEITEIFHPQAEVIEQYEDYMMILKSPEPVPKDQLLQILDLLKELKYVRQAGPVLYIDPEDPFSQLILTEQVEVKFPDHYTEEQIGNIEAEYGLIRVEEDSFIQNGFRYIVDDPLTALDTANRLFESGLVEYSYPGVIGGDRLNSIPNDTYFSEQWHLENTGQHGGIKGEDVNILPAWDTKLNVFQSILGTDVVIAIVDDGVEIDHEDLSPNTFPLYTKYHYDFIDGDYNPTPISSVFSPPGITPIIPITKIKAAHGTAVAGVAAGRCFNGKGICGAAPEAKLVGYRVGLFGATKGIQGLIRNYDLKGKPGNKAAALLQNFQNVHIYNNSWGKMPLLEIDPKLLQNLIKGTELGRQGLGNIYVFGAGNILPLYVNNQWTTDGLNSNYDSVANPRYVIAVAASTHLGKRAYYSALGANLLVNAPAGDATWGLPMITTTDRTDLEGYNPGGNDNRPASLPDYSDFNYTDSFGGTSSAAPLVSGIIALILQANPNLSWRDVQHILITTAEKNDPNDTDWKTNGAGYHINHKYGFGRIDAKAAVDVALSWTGIPDELEETKQPKGKKVENVPIPEVDGTIPENYVGYSSKIPIAENVQVEFVEVYFTATHNRWGDLDIILTSPAKTQSILAEQHYSSSLGRSQYDNWRFGSFRHFGETSRGDWILRVRDRKTGITGTFDEWSIKIYGTELPPTWSLTTPTVSTCGQDFEQGSVTCSFGAEDQEQPLFGDPLTEPDRLGFVTLRPVYPITPPDPADAGRLPIVLLNRQDTASLTHSGQHALSPAGLELTIMPPVAWFSSCAAAPEEARCAGSDPDAPGHKDPRADSTEPTALDWHIDTIQDAAADTCELQVTWQADGQDRPVFLLNAASFDAMRASGVSDAVIATMLPLQDVAFSTEAALNDAIRDYLSWDDWKAHKTKILSAVAQQPAVLTVTLQPATLCQNVPDSGTLQGAAACTWKQGEMINYTWKLSEPEVSTGVYGLNSLAFLADLAPFYTGDTFEDFKYLCQNSWYWYGDWYYAWEHRLMSECRNNPRWETGPSGIDVVKPFLVEPGEPGFSPRQRQQVTVNSCGERSYENHCIGGGYTICYFAKVNDTIEKNLMGTWPCEVSQTYAIWTGVANCRYDKTVKDVTITDGDIRMTLTP